MIGHQDQTTTFMYCMFLYELQQNGFLAGLAKIWRICLLKCQTVVAGLAHILHLMLEMWWNVNTDVFKLQ